MSDILREFKEMIPPGQEKTAGVLFAESVWLRAINGDPTCVQVVMKWLDGLPPQRIEAAVAATVKMYGNVSPDDWDQEENHENAPAEATERDGHSPNGRNGSH